MFTSKVWTDESAITGVEFNCKAATQSSALRHAGNYE